MTEPTGPRPSRRADRNAAAPGRRAGGDGGRKVDLVVALAVALPANVGLGIAAVGDPSDKPAPAASPATTSLTSATLACPGPLAKHPQTVLAARAPQVAGGPVTVRRSAPNGRLDTGRPTTVTGRAAPTGSGPVVLDATGAAAPGLVAGRREPAAAVACQPPEYAQWFLGVSGSAVNGSVLRLANPDAAQAVVDTTLLGPKGPVVENKLRGLVVPGNSVLTVDLAKTVPMGRLAAAEVVVSRGRVGVSVEHRFDRLGNAHVLSDYLPPATGPTTDNLLLGASGEGGTLYLANPGQLQARATVRVLDRESAFTPTGTKPVVVPPQSMVEVSVRDVVPKSAAKGMLGLVVDSDQPLLAGERSVVSGDLAAVGSSPTVTGATAAIVPDGPTSLLIAGATKPGDVELTVSDARGRTLIAGRTVELTAGGAARVTLPKHAAVVTLQPRNTAFSASLVTVGPRATSVVPVRDTQVRSQVPAIRPE